MRRCSRSRATPLTRGQPRLPIRPTLTRVSGACPLASTLGEGGHWVTSLSDWLAAPIDRRAATAQARKRNMAEAGKEHAGLGLPVGEAAQWPLQRYGRFMPSGTGEPPGPGQEAGMASSPTWKVRPEGGKGWEALTRRREGRTTAAWFLRHCVSSIGRWILNTETPRKPLPCFSSVQSLSRVWLFATPWITARQASLSITNSRSSLRLTSIESVMPSNHLILCHPLLLLPPIPPSIRVFSNESTLHVRWPKYWEFQLQHQSLQWTPRTDLL